MPPRIKSATLVTKYYLFGAGQKTHFFCWEVKMKDERDKLGAVGKCFKENNCSRPFLKIAFETDDLVWINLRLDVVKFLKELLLEPVLEIRFEPAEYDKDDGNPVIQRRFDLQDISTDDDCRPLHEREYAMKLFFGHVCDGLIRNRVCRINVRWFEPSKTVKLCPDSDTLLGKMFDDEPNMDLVIIAGNGAEISCHKLIFAYHSPVFSGMVSDKIGMKEALSKRIEMKENSEEGIRQLVRFMYGRELAIGDMPSELALELLETAHKYELDLLENCLVELFQEGEADWFTPNVALELYLHVRNLAGSEFEQLRDRALSLMASMPTAELRSCKEFEKMNKADSTDLSLKLVDHLQKKYVPKRKLQGGNEGGGIKQPRASE